MENFIFYNPTKLIFGQGELGKIGNEIIKQGLTKVLLLYGKGSIFENGVYNKAVSSLRENNISFVELGGVKPNPVISKVYEGIDIIKKEKIEGILAIGGGSVIDSAKAIAAGAVYHGDIWEVFEGKGKIEGALPIFSILTISATASEMDAGAVIMKEDERKKWSFGSPHVFPKVSIVDPTIQYTLPVKQTISGAIDAMSHVFEFYFEGTKNRDLLDEICEGILRSVMKHVKILLNEPDNYDSRSQLALSATLALNGLTGMGSKGGDWATHNIEHSVSAFTDVTHGIGLAILHPAWMQYVYKEDIKKFERFAERVFNITEGSPEDKVLKAIEKLKGFFKEIGAPTSLKEIAVKIDDLNAFAENAAIFAPLGKLKPLFKEDIYKILEIAFE